MPRGTRNAQEARLDGLRRIANANPLADWMPLYEAWLRESGLPMVGDMQRYADIRKVKRELRPATFDRESFAWGLASGIRDIFQEQKSAGARGANAALNAYDRLDKLFNLRGAVQGSADEDAYYKRVMDMMRLAYCKPPEGE